MVVKFVLQVSGVCLCTGTPFARSSVLRLRGGMRCVVQRVKSASVSVEGEVVARSVVRLYGA
jgi:hypothetical protein